MIQSILSKCALYDLFLILFGIFVSSLTSIYLAGKRDRNHRRVDETTRFRVAFSDALVRLHKGNDDVYKISSVDVLAKHQSAKILFEPWLSPKKRRAFNEAWNKYENQWVRTKSPGSLDNRQSECQEAIKQIDELLMFTN